MGEERKTHLVLRTCLGCRESKEKGSLIRLVLLPDGTLHADLEGKLPGRGAYVCPRQRCIVSALHPKKLERAFRRQVSPPDPEHFLSRLLTQKREKIATLLGLAQKAGRLVSGHARLMQALQRGEIVLLLMAEDIAPERRSEYEQLCQQQQITCYSLLTKHELGACIGKELRSAVGLKDARFAKVFDAYLPLSIS
ncbi:MAG: DUF448 domain-containing protein [Nitrospinota bacterium]|nr:MAG: DUF448 domain-containing protein [Nitrospinota bacterium]